jgi:hypothetical protein
MDTNRMEHTSVTAYNMPGQMSEASRGNTSMQQGQGPRPEHEEGPVARTIEQQTAKLPSDTFLWAALASMGVSLALQLTGNQKTSLFIGQWAPSFLLLGLYNKVVKVAGSH